MIKNLFSKVVGTRNDRQLRRMRRSVERINALEPGLSALSRDELRAQTETLRTRVGNGEPLDSVLPEAFAVVREAGRRSLEMRHFDVQLLGGITLHEGRIAEMRTGEGKTLVATLPAYLNALTGRSVHIVTVNDYLARRDAQWMGAIYELLGMRTGVVVPGMNPADKRNAYTADVIYATNNELGFDYLRDNMAFSNADKMQRGLAFAIVDEVDSILIDEARTPLIISGPTDESSELYVRINRVIPRLERQLEEDGPGDYSVDEKAKQVHLTEDGHEKVEAVLAEAGILTEGQSLYDPTNIILVHHLNAALRAHALFQRNVEYIVRDGQIVIVDEFTGRTMPGRRWSEGLHQAIEAKEGVPIQNENQTLASITFQNYFRLYEKLAGMTGTADTEAAEFQQIYGLEVVVVPTHLEMIRDDMARSRLPHPGGEVRGGPGGHPGLHAAEAAGSGRHHVDRDLGAALAQAPGRGRRARGAEREAARTGGGDRRAGGTPRGGDHRDQHGRPRHGHRARRQPRGRARRALAARHGRGGALGGAGGVGRAP